MSGDRGGRESLERSLESSANEGEDRVLVATAPHLCDLYRGSLAATSWRSLTLLRMLRLALSHTWISLRCRLSPLVASRLRGAPGRRKLSHHCLQPTRGKDVAEEHLAARGVSQALAKVEHSRGERFWGRRVTLALNLTTGLVPFDRRYSAISSASTATDAG